MQAFPLSLRETFVPTGQQPSLRKFAKQSKWCIVTAALAICLVGCSRAQYRRAADCESYGLIHSRQVDSRWTLPDRPVEPNPVSRMYLANECDCGPQPPDDPAAHRYMRCPDCKPMSYYDRIATRVAVENPAWLDLLPRTEDGAIELDQTLAIDLGLLNSREYQTEFERVYLEALDLSGNRFEFDTQWFGGVGADYTASGSDLGGGRVLRLSDRLGFGRNLAGGGQFATQMLNSVSWDFGNGGIQSGSAAIISTFTQPLLRGAFRHVRLESLTQAERDLLYQVRDFARFRRQFYVGISEQYLGLLTQAQAIRNIETNVENLKQNLIEHEFYSALKVVSQVQVDQVFQQYQNGRRSLLSAQQNLITLEDRLKLTLGLPAWVRFKIDESLLEPFELVDPVLVEMQDEAQELFESLVQYLPPTQAPANELRKFYGEFKLLRELVAEMLPDVEADLKQWQSQLENADRSTFTDDDQLDFDQQQQLAKRIAGVLVELQNELADREKYNEELAEILREYEENPPAETEQQDQKTLADILKGIESFEDVTLEDILPSDRDDTAIAAWKALEQAIGRVLREEIAELFVAQTQIKLFLIEIEPRQIDSETAITYAHQNRLDLMNSKAIAVDAFRRVEVAADALESDLDVTGGVRIGSAADSNNPFDFDADNNVYNIGVQFDGPLNRLNERNAYRAAQIAYQQASRNFIAGKDQVANEVRLILRRLELSRVNFQIARQQVVAATRQVDQAQIDLRRSSQADANLTIILLQALEGMLDAKNSLIVNWVEYRVQKMRLFVALEMLYLDENGNWLNEESGLEMIEGYKAIDPEYFPPHWFSQTTDSNDESIPQVAAPGEQGLIDSNNFEEVEVELLDAPKPIPEAEDQQSGLTVGEFASDGQG